MPLQTTSAILQFRNVQNICFAVSVRSNRHESCDLTSKSRPQIRLALSQGRIRYLDRNICGHRRMRLHNPLKCHSGDCRRTTNENLFEIDSRPICVFPLQRFSWTVRRQRMPLKQYRKLAPEYRNSDCYEIAWKWFSRNCTRKIMRTTLFIC